MLDVLDRHAPGLGQLEEDEEPRHHTDPSKGPEHQRRAYSAPPPPPIPLTAQPQKSSLKEQAWVPTRSM